MRLIFSVLVGLSLALTLFACAPAATPASPAEFRIPPYLVYTAQPDSMTVMWKASSTPRQAHIEWGADETLKGGKAEVKDAGGESSEHLMAYTIQGLKPGTRTYYRVSMDGSAYAANFVLGPQNAGNFSLYAVSDTQVNPAIQNKLMGGILGDIAKSPDTRQTVLLHGGDFVSHGLVETDWLIEYFNAYYKDVSRALGSLPVVGALGNHQLYEAKEYVKVCAKPYARVYRKYFPYPFYVDPQHFYYSFDYGPVHVAVIDPYTAEYQPGSAQYAWLQADLAKPAAYRIVLMHQTAWAYRRGAFALRQHLHPLFKASGVNVVLQGHEHYYNRLVVDGIQYVTIGGGGGSLVYPDKYRTYYDDPEDAEVMSSCVDVAYDPNPELPAVELVDPQKAFRINHYLRMDWDGKAMSIRAVDIDGNVFDCFPQGAACSP